VSSGSRCFSVSVVPPPVADAFDDAGDGEQTLVKDGAKSNYVHIRIQQRNGRKSLTTVQGLAIDLDLKKILKALKKVRTPTPG
jgi:translation initiation factor SUI1